MEKDDTLVDIGLALMKLNPGYERVPSGDTTLNMFNIFRFNYESDSIALINLKRKFIIYIHRALRFEGTCIIEVIRKSTSKSYSPEYKFGLSFIPTKEAIAKLIDTTISGIDHHNKSRKSLTNFLWKFDQSIKDLVLDLSEELKEHNINDGCRFNDFDPEFYYFVKDNELTSIITYLIPHVGYGIEQDKRLYCRIVKPLDSKNRMKAKWKIMDYISFNPDDEWIELPWKSPAKVEQEVGNYILGKIYDLIE